MDSFEELWNTCIELLRERHHPARIKTWVECLRPVNFENDTFTFTCPTAFQYQIINDHFIDEIKKALADVMGFEVGVSLVLEADYGKKPVPKPQKPVISNFGDSDKPKSIFNEYTFENFIVGSGNKFAHAASVAVATQPAEAYNPLFIYGGSGLGKTHLITAIGNYIRENFPSSNVLYVKSEDFSNELISAIQNNTTQQFKNKYRLVDVLLMDDIQFIGGKESTQEEFFHTFNTLYNAKKQIVLTSDRPPKEIRTLEERLRTRFEWGLIADVQPPDYEMRCAVITKKAEKVGIEMPIPVVEFLATRLKSNVRQLEGAVQKIKAFRILNNRPVDIQLASDAIKDILSDSVPVSVTVNRVIEDVSKYYNISIDDLKGSKRNAELVNARFVAMYVIREVTDLSLPLIGEAFGGRHHTTVLNAIKEIEKNMETNYRLKSEVNDFIKNISV
ncbi:MAG: chromosomal replication initiator protein DnaA [Bacillota bacterium]|nr:chromosomal replication initiator protein DnaA [Bacillota bacterium]